MGQPTSYKRAKGCFDIHPEAQESWKDTIHWNRVENLLKEIASIYEYREIRTPIFESTDLFIRSSGKASDIVSKEMYTFEDKKGRSLTLRPELTAPLLRAYLQNGLTQSSLAKIFYLGPCFRYDRAQKGRYRQFNQFGIEILGAKNTFLEAEAIIMLFDLCKQLEIPRLTLLLNNIGSFETRKKYSEALLQFLTPHYDNLSKDSKIRFKDNPLRILDSKDNNDRTILTKAPSILDFLTPEENNAFEHLQTLLTNFSIPFKVDPYLVRGLDYYSNTVFELVQEDNLSRQNSIAAGGRYDNLIEQLGGPKISGFGFALGIERLIQTMLDSDIAQPSITHKSILFLPLLEKAKPLLFNLLDRARQKKIPSSIYLRNYNPTKALQLANEQKYSHVVIAGKDELQNETLTVKDLKTRSSEEIPITKFEHDLKIKELL